MHFSKPCKHNNHGHCPWCQIDKENMSEYFRLVSGYCEHGKKGKCVMCDSEKLMKEIDESIASVKKFLEETDKQILNDLYKEYQKDKMSEEYGVKNRIGKWL